MIDRVELVFLDEPEQVRELEGCTPCGFRMRGTRHEVVDIRHMGENVVRRSEIGSATLGEQLVRQIAAEKCLDDGDPFLARGRARCLPSAPCRGRGCPPPLTY